MRLQHFFVLALSACTAAYMKKTVYRSDELGARSADLLECLTQLEALLEVHPNSTLPCLLSVYPQWTNDHFCRALIQQRIQMRRSVLASRQQIEQQVEES